MSKFSVRELMNTSAEAAAEETAAPQLPTERTIDQITVEINWYKQQTVQNIIEIGRRLIEAKAMLPHGTWMPWLEQSVELTQSTANRFMKVAREFSNSAPVRNLDYSKLLALIQVPADEREEFLAESHLVDGEEKTVDEMSRREIETAIRERNAAREQAESAKKEALAAQEQAGKEHRRALDLAEASKHNYDSYMETLTKLEKLQEQKEQADQDRQSRIRQLERRIAELEARPVDVAIREPDEAERERLREQLRTELLDEQAAEGSDEVPPELIQKAAAVFSDAIHAAYQSFEVIALASLPQYIVEPTEDCILAGQDLLDDLRGLSIRAKQAMYRFDGRRLPDEEEF